METTGTIKQAYSYGHNNYILAEVESLPQLPEGEKITIEFKKLRKKKRSLDANAYHWTLCSKMANVLRSSAVEVHYQLMLDYGTPLKDKNGMPVVAALPDGADLRSIELYGRLISVGELNHYLIIKPSRYYDTEEMSKLIEGTIYEAKELGIETLTPRELFEMGILKGEKDDPKGKDIKTAPGEGEHNSNRNDEQASHYAV